MSDEERKDVTIGAPSASAGGGEPEDAGSADPASVPAPPADPEPGDDDGE